MLSRGLLLLIAALFMSVSLLPADVAMAGQAHIKSAGCKTEYYLLKDLAKAYEAKTGAKLRTASTGNKKAMNLMLSSEIDFAFTCKPISKLSKKLKLDPAKVGGWKSLPIAKDPIVVVANNGNGVTGLSVEQLIAVFEGNVSNWSEVGGADQPIQVAYFDASVESGSQLLFKEFTVGINGQLKSDAKRLGGPAKLGNFVSRTAGGISFMPLNAYQGEYGTILAIDGVKPSQKTIVDGSYPLVATYFLTVDTEGNSEVDAFVSYCFSEQGRQVIARNFIPVSQ